MPALDLQCGGAATNAVDQINIQVPDDVIDGCSVPLQLSPGLDPGSHASQRVPVSIRNGGGACVDPPPDGLGMLNLIKTTASGITPAPPPDQLQASFASALSKQPPPPVSLTDEFKAEHGILVAPKPRASNLDALKVVQPGQCQCAMDLAGAAQAAQAPACPGFTQYEDSALDAGLISIQGPNGGPVRISPSPAQDGSYSASLPAGTLQPGVFQVSGLGGAGVGPFAAGLQIPPPIQITTDLSPGTTFSVLNKLYELPIGILGISWTGGDPAGMVRILASSTKVSPSKTWYNVCECAAWASAGGLVIYASSPFNNQAILEGDNVEIRVDYRSEGTQQQQFGAQGLTLGGYLGWIYRYRFGGIIIKAVN